MSNMTGYMNPGVSGDVNGAFKRVNYQEISNAADRLVLLRFIISRQKLNGLALWLMERLILNKVVYNLFDFGLCEF